MKKALEELPRSALAKDISDRIRELERQYNLDPNIMRNGRPLPEKRWSLGFSQELRHDRNITLGTDVPSSAATQKESFAGSLVLAKALYRINDLLMSDRLWVKFLIRDEVMDAVCCDPLVRVSSI